jgi:alcohol dehydrogenase class IV
LIVKENYHELYVGTSKNQPARRGRNRRYGQAGDKQWGKALIVTDGQLVKLGLLDSLFTALDAHQMSYHLFDEVFPNPTEALVQKGLRLRTRSVIT